jgi:hypothetical protein
MLFSLVDRPASFRRNAAITVVSLLVFLAPAPMSLAQIPRTRANERAPAAELFLTPALVTMPSVQNLPKGNLNVTIMHTFGLLRSGVNALFGLDDSANIRFGIDVGVTDAISVGVGRSRLDKVYDSRIKVALLSQTRDDRRPFAVALAGNVGITTDENGFDLVDRLSFFGSLPVARSFGETMTLQAAPMVSHFNTVYVRNELNRERNTHYAIGFGLRLLLNSRVDLLLEYVAVVGPRSDGMRNAAAAALDIETGGHVFQVFVKTSQWLLEQYVVARNPERFMDGDLRFGFNVNRVFGDGGN